MRPKSRAQGCRGSVRPRRSAALPVRPRPARPTLRPRRSAALPVRPQGQWSPCHSQWRVRKPFGSTKAPRQWFSNDLPLVCAPAVLPCAPCRAPTVSKCSAQGKALRKDTRGTGMAEERIERSTCLSQAFGAPRGLCEALSQWQTECFALGARQGAHCKTVCTRSVFKTKALPNTGAVGGACRGGRDAVLPCSRDRLAPPCGRDGARPSRCGRDRLGGTPRPTVSASLHDLPMATLGTANTPYQRLPCQCPKMIPYPRRRQSQH